MAIEITPALTARLESLASELHRPVEEIAVEAIDGYLRRIEVLTAEVREGEQSAATHGWLTTDEVFDRLHSRLRKIA